MLQSHRLYFLTRHRGLMAVLLSLMLAACGGSSSNSVQPAPIAPVPDEVPAEPTLLPDDIIEGPVVGYVAVDETLVGATVTLETHDGVILTLAQGINETQVDGIFRVETAEARRGLRVVVTGGETSQESFGGTLSAYVETEGDFHDAIDVNIVTTLVDRVRMVGELSAEEAESRVRHFLSLPDDLSIQSDFRFSNDFDPRLFMQRAADEVEEGPGGFDYYLDILTDDILSGLDFQRSYARQTPLLGSPTIMTTIAYGLISGAASNVGDNAMGRILSGLGLGKSKDVINKLQEISKQLGAIEGKVDEVNKRVADLAKQVADAGLAKEVSALNVMYKDLQLLPSLPAAEQKRVLRGSAYSKGLLERISELEDKRTLFSETLSGANGASSSSLIKVHANSLSLGQRFYSIRHENELKAVVNFYDTYNIQLYYLLMELYRFEEAENIAACKKTALEQGQTVDCEAQESLQGLINERKKELDNARAIYLAMLPRSLPSENAFIQLSTGQMWIGAPYVHYISFAPYFPVNKWLPNFGGSTADYRVDWGGRHYIYNNSSKYAWPVKPEQIAGKLWAKKSWMIPSEPTLWSAFVNPNKLDAPSWAKSTGAPEHLFKGSVFIWSNKCEVDRRETSYADTYRIKVSSCTFLDHKRNDTSWAQKSGDFQSPSYNSAKPTAGKAHHFAYWDMTLAERQCYLPWLEKSAAACKY